MIPQNSQFSKVFSLNLHVFSQCLSPSVAPLCFAVAEALALALAVGHGASSGHGSEIELERMALGFIHM
jgi:hypothetical protein